MSLATSFGWLRRPGTLRRTDAPPRPAPREARPGRALFRWGVSKAREAKPILPADSLLRLVAEWMIAQGGSVLSTGADELAGTLADGSPVSYTRSAPRALADERATLLTAGAPGLEAIFDDLARRASTTHLSLEASAQGAEAIARAAFVAPGPGCTTCVQPGAPAFGRACGPECPLAEGRFIVIGLERGVREVRLEDPTSAPEVEYAFRLVVSSQAWRGEEVLRVCADARTGEILPPLPAALLASATNNPDFDSARDLPGRVGVVAEAYATRAAGAVARLARLQSFAAYRERQEHITRTYDQLLLESPERGPELLEARARDLARYAESSAVECELHALAATTVRVPLARAHVRFAGGGEAVTELDLLRERAAEPRCDGCGVGWRVGVRCASGHVTCLACSRACAHCGLRRCSLCASSPFAACATCGAVTCARCAALTARGKHRLARHGTAPATVSAAPPVDDAPLGADDLTLDDLTVMPEHSWRRFTAWLLSHEGFEHEHNLEGDARGPIALYRRRSAAAGTTVPALAAAGTTLAVVSQRPSDPDAWVHPDDRARAARGAASLAGATPVLITTARVARAAGREAGHGIVLDCDVLAAALDHLRGDFERQRTAQATELQRRADAAASVRATLIEGLAGAAATLDDTAATTNASSPSPRTTDAEIGRRAVVVVRQALAATETLIEEWEHTFGPTAARDGSLVLLVDAARYSEQQARASHLSVALTRACSAFITTDREHERDASAWWDAVREELSLRTRALTERCAARDPLAWPSFARAHDPAAEARAAELLAASGRAALRARRVLDEPNARVPVVPPEGRHQVR